MFLTPDMVQKALYQLRLSSDIQKGALLLFAHGFAIHYGRSSRAPTSMSR